MEKDTASALQQWQKLAFSTAIVFSSVVILVASSAYAFTSATLFSGNEDIPTGSLVRLSEVGDVAEVTVVEYDENLLGVAIDPAPVVYRSSRDASGVAVVESGVIDVLVSTINGSIARGDFVTSSAIAGVAQRADDLSRTVAGVAIDSFGGGTNTVTHKGQEIPVGSIRVLLDIGPAMIGDAQTGAMEGATSDFIDIVSQALRDLLNQPGGTALFFRYIVALLITLLAVFFSLQHFGRAALRGIEAVGRNPLARRYITFTVAMNVFLGVIVSGAAIILSFLMIV